MNIDASQVTQFAQRLTMVPAVKQRLVKAAVKRGAQNIKNAVQADVRTSSNPGFRQIPIAYEMQEKGTTITARIAPTMGGAGNLGYLAFHGTARGGGTHQFYEHGVKEFPQTVKYVQLAAKGLS